MWRSSAVPCVNKWDCCFGDLFRGFVVARVCLEYDTIFGLFRLEIGSVFEGGMWIWWGMRDTDLFLILQCVPSWIPHGSSAQLA